MVSKEMNTEHFRFSGDFEIFLISIVNKMQMIVLENDLKGLILGTNTDKLYSFLRVGDPSVRVHPSCCLYLLSYYCPLNPS